MGPHVLRTPVRLSEACLAHDVYLRGTCCPGRPCCEERIDDIPSAGKGEISDKLTAAVNLRTPTQHALNSKRNTC